MNLLNKSILQLSKLLEDRKISTEELFKAYMDNIEAKEAEHKVYNIVLKEEGIKRAIEIDKKRQRGEPLGLLAGIPMAMTDDISTKGILTTAGSKILENYIPPFNATVVERLLGEDVIILGKLKINEFGLKVSQGPSEALMAEEAVFALSSHIGGKGTVAIKPSYGAVSRYGYIGATSSLDQIGATSKSIEDMAIILNTIIGHDRRDSTSVDFGDIDYREQLSTDIKGIKIGIPKEFLEGNYDLEIKEVFLNQIKKLESLGAIIQEISIPNLDYILPAYYIIFSGEFASNTGRYDGIGFGYRAKDYEDREDLYKKTRSQGFGMEAKKTIIFGNYVISEGQYERYYQKAQRVRALIKDELNKILKDNHIILSPIGDKMDIERMESYRLLANMTGLPAMSIPYNKENNKGHIGLQAMTSAFEEDKLIKLGYTLEKSIENMKNVGGEK